MNTLDPFDGGCPADTMSIQDPDKLAPLLVEPPSANGTITALFGRANSNLHMACAKLLTLPDEGEPLRETWLRDASRAAWELHRDADRLSAIVGGLRPANDRDVTEDQHEGRETWAERADRMEGIGNE